MKIGPLTVTEICMIVLTVFVVLAFFLGWNT